MMKKLVLVMVVALMLGPGMVSAQSDDDAVIVLQGQVTGLGGDVVAGAVIEIWQTDVNGNYDHPGDADPSLLLPNFQYFGTAVTDENGFYAFRTVVPAPYEPRPAHIHFKVKIDGVEALISQFYFIGDRPEAPEDAIIVDGQGGEVIFLEPVEQVDAQGNSVRVATGNIVLGIGEGSLIPTSLQGEGPYYPVVDFSGYDNDLISTAADDEIVMPIMAFTLLNLNTASGDEFRTIPDVGDRMVREFEEYRPYISILQFRREIGKYVDEAQVAAYEAYVYVPIRVDESDTATLMQIPGVDETIAEALIAARPFGSHEAFITALAAYLSPRDAAFAVNYLE
jgi:hypothetical protein